VPRNRFIHVIIINYVLASKCWASATKEADNEKRLGISGKVNIGGKIYYLLLANLIVYFHDCCILDTISHHFLTWQKFEIFDIAKIYDYDL